MTPRKITPPRLEAPNLSHELALWSNGALWVAGVDEAGRGAWAGPVVAAAVVLPQIASIQVELGGVRDSKKMSPAQRESWSHRIRSCAVTWGIGQASALEIDAWGIVAATRRAIHRALGTLSVVPDHLLVDYLTLPTIPLPQISLAKGDALSLSIAAASILAKTSRDALMVNLDRIYPGYNFAAHKGYGTLEHKKAIQRLGPSPVHRRSFQPLRTAMERVRGSTA